MKEDKRPYKIYTLEFRKQIFYVGVTQQWLAQRLNGHRNEEHIEQKHKLFQEFPNSILINEIDRADTKEEALRLEKYWIEQLTSWGFTLCNIRRDVPRFKKYQRKMTKVEFSPTDLHTINSKMKYGDCTIISKFTNVGPEMIRLHLTGKNPKIKYETYEMICKYYELPNRYEFLKKK